ncbi:MAG: glycosyltransferase family 2 protein, partial [Phycisphaerales bacterium]|nr:glycosyltransferase family 2 protein [Phycisphaerales bacterium]
MSWGRPWCISCRWRVSKPIGFGAICAPEWPPRDIPCAPAELLSGRASVIKDAAVRQLGVEKRVARDEARAAPIIAVVIPCYKARQTILGMLDAMPATVDRVFCVDDGCPDKTGLFIEQNVRDQRVAVLYNPSNQGVGGAVMTGYRAALADDVDIIVKVDADGQMDPALIPRFVEPIAAGLADYTKGNRFYHPEWLEGMPFVRLCGNAVLSILTKFSTGYWHLFDPTNGFTAIHAGALKLLPLDKIAKGFFFESDMLFRLNTIRAVAMDVPQKAVYGEEESHLKIW